MSFPRFPCVSAASTGNEKLLASEIGTRPSVCFITKSTGRFCIIDKRCQVDVNFAGYRLVGVFPDRPMIAARLLLQLDQHAVNERINLEHLQANTASLVDRRTIFLSPPQRLTVNVSMAHTLHELHLSNIPAQPSNKAFRRRFFRCSITV